MSFPNSSRRASCAACLRAQSACICAWVRPVAPKSALLILQHPLEVANAKNSARLLHLCVAGSALAVGERFDPAELEALLHADGRTPLLLYPETPGVAARAADTLPPAEQVRLVVLDATWRKSRKMLYLNPVLQTLPRLALSGMPPSHYRIRRAHAPDQLSSMEAGAWALGQLEGDVSLVPPLFEAFEGFVEQQASYMPRPASI